MERAARLIGKLKVSSGLNDPEVRARAAWSAAAGKKIAAHARATTLVRDTLIVEVEDIVWQRQLSTLRHFLLRNLHGILGEPLVREIDFRPMPPARRAPQTASSARPLTTDEGLGIEDPIMSLLYRQSWQQNRRKAL
jgi:hypothetical protein